MQGVSAVQIDYILPQERIALVSFDTGLSLGEMKDHFENLPEVVYAEPNYLRYPTTLGLNDPLAGNLRALHNTGQTVDGIGGLADADIDAPEARAISTGAFFPVIVAVIDNGVAYQHVDLLPRMRQGSGCLDGSGNALGGCQYGYDFAQDDKNPLPLHYHGTHVA